MSNAMTTTTPRMIVIARLVLSLAVVFMLGAMLAQDVDARTKNMTGSVKKAVQNVREMCEDIGGGTLSVRKTPRGNAVTTCTGGSEDGVKCTITKKAVHCYQARETPPQRPLQDVGGPPSDGANEDPTDTGANPGGGGGVDPGPGADPDGGSQGPVLE